MAIQLRQALGYAIEEARKLDPPLHTAAKTGDLIKFQAEYVKTDPKKIEETDADRRTVMHHACEYEDCAILMFLINQPKLRPLVNRGEIMGQTPLHIAVKNANSLAIELLKAAGANEETQDLSFQTYKDLPEYSPPSSPPPQRPSGLGRSLRKSMPVGLGSLRKSVRRKSAPLSTPPQTSATFRALHQSFPRSQGSVTPDLANPQTELFRPLDFSPEPQRNHSLSGKVSQAVHGITDRFKETTDLP